MLLLFADYPIVYAENPKDPTKMQLKQSDFNKVTNLNAKSVVFLGNSNKLQNFKISFAIM